MSKVTLNHVANLRDTTTSQSTINADMDTISTAFDNTLSRDGTSPNAMGANLDMNSNRIINLPAPASGTEPVRASDLTTNSVLSFGQASAKVGLTSTIGIATTAAHSDSVPALDQSISPTWTGTHTFTSHPVVFSNGASFDANIDMKGNQILNLSSLNARPILAADATYYVRTDGSDSNNGLANTAGGAFKTIQHAVNVVYGLDLNQHKVTINVAAGTYAEDVKLQGALVGAPFGSSSPLLIIGDTTTPSNVTVSSTSWCFLAWGPASVVLRGLKFVSSGNALFTLSGGQIDYMSCEFGACTGIHVLAVGAGAFTGWSSNGTNIISGGATQHFGAYNNANVGGSGASTINLVGTPNFSDAFAVAEDGEIDCENITFTGTGATGVRFHAEYNGRIVPTIGSSATYLPGDQPGFLDDTSTYNQFSAISSNNLGTISSGTAGPLALSSTFGTVTARQWFYTNNGAHTLAAPTMDGYLRVLVTNGAAAGAITFTGFTTKASPGDALNTTVGNKFLIEIFTINSISTYRVYALQ